MKSVIGFFGLVSAFIVQSFSTVWSQQDSLAGHFDCVIKQDSSWTVGVPVAPSAGVAKGVAIYASYVTNAARPSWWTKIWDSTVQLSVPKFYKDNSLGQYSLQITPFGNGSQCFVTDVFPDTGTSGDQPPNGGDSFTSAILDSADKVINFANFDANGDNIVDALFLIIVNIRVSTNRGSTLALIDYETKDSSATGPIRIRGAAGATGGNGVALFALSEAGALSVSCHEWGHVFGLDDFYGSNGAGWWGLGGFSIMGSGFPSGRAVPFDPYNRTQLGWVTPIEVTAPLYQKTIADYLTTGTVYTLPVSGSEYFLATNHRGVDPFTDSVARWEEFFQGRGSLIWHVNNGGAPRNFNLKRVDIEAAHGLWNLSSDNKCRRTDTIPNPVSGKDSLDCGTDSSGIRFGYPANKVQSPTCFWNDSTKNTFDALSNPTSAVEWPRFG